MKDPRLVVIESLSGLEREDANSMRAWEWDNSCQTQCCQTYGAARYVVHYREARNVSVRERVGCEQSPHPFVDMVAIDWIVHPPSLPVRAHHSRPSWRIAFSALAEHAMRQAAVSHSLAGACDSKDGGGSG
jgi:hypothetical protein